MALPKNRMATMAILEEITPIVIGQRPKYFPSKIGEIATEIVPSGDSFPSEEVFPLLWNVIIGNETVKDLYTLCLDAFIPIKNLEEIFSKHLGTNRNTKNPYNLSVSGINRVVLGYPAAVRIRDNSKFVELSFDWGEDQKYAREICMSFTHGDLRLKDPIEIKNLILLLKDVKNIVLYSGGPVPQLSFESRWIDNYESALEIARKSVVVAVSYGTYTESKITVITSSTLTFYK